MKQIQKTQDIINRLSQSVGTDVDVDTVSIFEAIALNTLPLRKRHPLYNGSIADRSLLLEMAVDLSRESRPLQIMHDSSPLPIGRVFYGEVVDRGNVSELRVLFFVSKTEEDTIAKIDNGTVDQVSVSVLPLHIYNSVSGFDYLGPNATSDNMWSGTDPDGNTLGENGVYGRLVGLDSWFEMSLVGQGGARNARIVSRDASHFGSSYQKLAASGVDPNALVLVASTRNEKMDLETLVASLTETKASVIVKDSEIASLKAALAERDSKIADLEAQLSSIDPEVEATTAKLTEVTEERDSAFATLSSVAKKVLTAAGKVTDEVPETITELSSVIENTTSELAALLVSGGRSKEASSQYKSDAPASLGAFRVNRK